MATEAATEAKAKGGKGKKGGKGAAVSRIAEKQTEKLRRTTVARLRQVYQNELREKLQKELGLANVMEVPRLVKVTINMGLGDAVANPKILDSAVEELALIAGQMPVVTRAKKAIATYKLREGQKIGAMVTLRQDTMYEFLDRLISFALPRVRDFKGISPKGFDGRGNFTMGVREGIIFPEASFEGADKARGMNISIVTTARTDEQARALLRHLGMPFRN
ncbi:MAG: 50S ribosomal protein L5 [Myxococcales bacterium]|nr:50S ribosomal protein L5 [Myxococcales bacterium]